MALFWVLKALYMEGERGGIFSSTTTLVHLDDATAAILHQKANHTPAYCWRGDRVMKPISVWGGHDGQRPMGEFGQVTMITP